MDCIQRKMDFKNVSLKKRDLGFGGASRLPAPLDCCRVGHNTVAIEPTNGSHSVHGHLIWDVAKRDNLFRFADSTALRRLREKCLQLLESPAMWVERWRATF